MGISGQTIWRQTGNFLRKQKIIRKITYYESGLKLPKSCSDWSLANDHFKAVLSNYPIRTEDLNSNIERMNNVIFEYFSMTCGEVDRGGDINLRNKYDTYTVKDLKGAVK